MRSTNINFKKVILFFVYNGTCWLEKCPAVNTHVLYLESLQQLASSSVLGPSSATATISADWPEGEGERERKGERREREKGERRWILG